MQTQPTTAIDTSRFLIFYALYEYSKGHCRSTISDCQRGRLLIVNNDVYDFAKANHKRKIPDIFKDYDEESQEAVNQYIKYFLDNDLAFIGTKEDCKSFTTKPFEWGIPANISNIIIEHSEKNLLQFNIISKIIDSQLIIAVQYISFKEELSFQKIMDLCDMFNECHNVSSISFLVKYSDTLDSEKLPDIVKKACFFELLIHSAPLNFNYNNFIIYTEEKITSYSNCGNIIVDNFSVDKDLFMETHFHNVCLNRKLCIDHNGNIKNCLSMDKIFGNIFEDDVEQIVNSPDFQKFWHIKKDQIDVCKDCEFRYICTDCRCFIKDLDNIYSQPAKCGYNPYIAKWQNEDGYVSVEACGKYSKETGFVPDDEKIKELNNKIWGEDE